MIHDSQTGEVLATITVLELRGSKVKLGIDAPDKVRVSRDEMFSTDSTEDSTDTTGRIGCISQKGTIDE